MKKTKRVSSSAQILVDDCVQPSLFSFYVRAAVIAVKLNIGLEYAYRRYVKPSIIEDASLVPFTDEEYRACFPDEFGRALARNAGNDS
jgi:hypothetical protein